MHEYHISIEGLFSHPFISTFHAQSDAIARKVAIMVWNGLSENLMFRVTLVRQQDEDTALIYSHTAPGGLELPTATMH